MTEYAEGELFQILEDDGSLPENQVHQWSHCFTVTDSSTNLISISPKNRICSFWCMMLELSRTWFTFSMFLHFIN